MTRCPCGQGNPYDDCCGRLHRGETIAATAEGLMRSRYAAFAVGDPEFLLASWHPTTRPPDIELDPGRRWTFLEVLATARGGLLDDTGTVEFRAHYRADGRSGSQHEISRFRREGGRWFYLDGRTG